MGFSKEIYTAAVEELRQRREAEIYDAGVRKGAFTMQHPEYLQMERELSQTGALLARTIFCGGSGSDDIADIRERNLGLQRSMTALLLESGLTADALEPHFECGKCKDTGIADGFLCDCLKKIMRRIASEQLNAVTPLSLSTFESFSLDHYSDEIDGKRRQSQRQIMETILNRCKSYAENFSLSSPSLLFQGGVGLGKTHLSLAIAGKVIDKGYGVIYGSSNSFFNKLEREHFGRDSGGDDTLELLCTCDLLILDDLGTEFVTQFTISSLHDIINTRLLAGRPTIISTNLDMTGLEKKYSERLVSRIVGSYDRYPFDGKDMRYSLRRAGNRPKKSSGEQ